MNLKLQSGQPPLGIEGARRIIAALGLVPHPEGGWYRETWRADAAPGARSAGTAIHFLLEAGQRSHWHRVDADELWLWHAGAGLEVRIADDVGLVETVRLGGDVIDGESPQCLVPGGRWQSTEAPGGWGLVSCVVVPGFDFAGFELAPPGWAPPAP
ncbi:cupin domain-containing protein [Sphingomonas sp. M1-B02]|uniref:cupin domain-containing protein n=1 Tax=Sphingomonas sp. M1-B02 TaxID=3114300 RepID=UPI00223EFF43|nr:cupin domain-containing protein [Sphingomonas sp. S6-11]UZK65944.1 cupin domain-containing protein [Sphingomonas sp. S6-11]